MQIRPKRAGTVLVHTVNELNPPLEPISIAQKTLNILYWIFPPTLLWGLFKLGMTRALGTTIGKVIFKATATQNEKSAIHQKYIQHRSKFNDCMNKKEWGSTLANASDVHIEEFNVRVPGAGITDIDAVIISPQKKDGVKEDKKVDTCIVKFMGISGYFERMKEPAQDPKEEGKFDLLQEGVNEVRDKHCHYIIFNHRGVGMSRGLARTHHDLVSDARAIASYVFNEKKIAPKKTIFKAHSFGGAISACVAADLKDRGYDVKEFSSRSFGMLSDAAAKEGWGWRIKRALYHFIFSVTGWEINAGAALMKLDHYDYDYYNVRSSSEDRKNQELQLCDDMTIPHRASVHMAVKKARKFHVQEEKELAALTMDKEQRPAQGLDEKGIRQAMREESNRHKMKGVKMIGGKKRDAHDASGDELVCRGTFPGIAQPLNGKSKFDWFYRRRIDDTYKPTFNFASGASQSVNEEKSADPKEKDKHALKVELVAARRKTSAALTRPLNRRAS